MSESLTKVIRMIDDDIEGNNKLKGRKLNYPSSHFPTLIFYVDGRKISPSEIVNVAPGEGQIPVSFTLEPNWVAPAFSKDHKD